MLDYAEYTIDGEAYQGNGYHSNGHNGYDKLDGDWKTYYQVGKNFTGRVKPEDREDFLHDLFLAFARVKASYQAKGKELTTGGLVRIAQYAVADYWRKWYRRTKGISCGDCGKAQKEKCRRGNFWIGDCPKAIELESLDTLVEDGNGDSTPLYELIADHNPDIVARVEARLILDGYPQRFVQLAYKKYAGYTLTESEGSYYRREQKKAQKTLL